MLRRVLRHLALSAMLLTASTGCGGAHYSEPIASFGGSVTKSGAALQTYYTGLNKLERDVYLYDALYDPNMNVVAMEGKEPTALFGKFSASSIKARTDAIALLGVYVEQLGALAGSDAPKRFATGSEQLGQNLSNLGNTFTSLSTDTAQPDPSAAAYAGPIGKLVGVVGKLILETERDRAVTLAIESGAPNVRAIMDLLQTDVTTVIVPLQQTAFKLKIATLTNYYNQHRSDPMPVRKQMLDEIGALADQYEATVTANPANLISSMRSAHEALVAYARSDKSPASLADLVGALSTFRDNAKEISDAVLAIKALKEGK